MLLLSLIKITIERASGYKSKENVPLKFLLPVRDSQPKDMEVKDVDAEYVEDQQGEKIILTKVKNCQRDTDNLGKHCKCCEKFGKPEKLEDFQCALCEYRTSYKNSRNFKKHMNRHSNDTLSNNVCEDCGFESTSKRKFKVHIKENHKERKMHICHICPYKSIKNGNVKKHIEHVHEGIRISCHQCDKKFTQHSDLDNHRVKAHGVIIDTVMKCDECEFTTPYRKFFTVHKKKHFTNNKKSS